MKKIIFERNTSSFFYSSVFSFSVFGLSLFNTSKPPIVFRDKNRNYVAVKILIKTFGFFQIYKRKRVTAFTMDERIIQLENQHYDYSSVLKQLMILWLEPIFQKKE